MRLVIFGPPGAGKGTQAQFVAQHYAITHVSTGDIFRENIRNQTPLGIEAKRFADAGNLVPDDLTNAMVRTRLSEADCRDGFLIDGYPRTTYQADTFEALLAEWNVKLDAVINMIVPDEEIIERLSKRGRSDDSAETIIHRLDVYHGTTQPLIEYYRNRNLLRDVEGVGPIDIISRRIFESLNHLLV